MHLQAGCRSRRSCRSFLPGLLQLLQSLAALAGRRKTSLHALKRRESGARHALRQPSTATGGGGSYDANDCWYTVERGAETVDGNRTAGVAGAAAGILLRAGVASASTLRLRTGQPAGRGKVE